MELSQPHYSVCEEQGTLSLSVNRKGNLAESSYVTVKVPVIFYYNRFILALLADPKIPVTRFFTQVNEVTATAAKDFLINPSSLIQFDPGMY